MRRTPVILMALALALPGASAGQTPVRLVVDADLGKDTISRHIYGHFAEHLGRDIYDGFWYREGNGPWHLRDDVIEALRRIRIPNLRWPGGCFADYYHWEDGIGPLDRRPKMVNTVWGGVTEDNSFGTHEYMELVRRLAAEPFIVGNVGSGTVKEMADWWEYLNHPGGSMTAAHYADVYKRFATFLRPMGDTRAFRVATGPNVDSYAWTETVMREARGMLDAIDLHYYTVVGPWQHKGSATDFTEQQWFVAVQKALRMDELIRRHSAIMDQYDPRKRVRLMVGEWGMWHDVQPGTNPGFLYQQNSLRDAVVAGLHLNIFNNHADRVRAANIAQTVNVLQSMVLTRGSEMVLTPTYHVFDLYQVHQEAVLLPLSIESDDYAFEGQSVPAVSASASRDAEGRIHVTLANLDPNRPRTIRAELRGAQPAGVTGRVLTATAMNAHNTFEHPAAVQPAPFRGARLTGAVLTVELPSKSVVALELK